MGKMTFKTGYEEFNSLEELSSEQRTLISKAIEAGKNAYAPYSGFNVGAAVRLENGEIITGSNQENAAYPSGLCAERVALFYAGAKYPGTRILSVAIAATKGGKPVGKPVSPCGGCRQVMVETERRHARPMEILLYGTEKIRIIHNASDLLPLPFTLEM